MSQIDVGKILYRTRFRYCMVGGGDVLGFKTSLGTVLKKVLKMRMPHKVGVVDSH